MHALKSHAARMIVICGLFALAGCSSGAGGPAPAAIPNRTFQLTDYSAVPDGHTLNTDSFKHAVAAISAGGGGRLVVPAGTWLTLPFSLTSHMELHLEPGAVIQFPTDISAYGLPADPTQATAQQRADLKAMRSLIFGERLTDVSITGPGVIDGGGSAWWSTNRGPGRTPYGNDRPKLIILDNCQRLVFQDITLRNSPMWNLVPTQSRDILIERVKVLAPAMAPNTDALDPQGCDNVVMRDCDLDEGDDNVAIKAIDAPCTNILVENCRCKHGHGISIGSETYHGIHNVTVRHCTFEGTDNGIRIKSARDRGNDLYNFEFSDITMTGVKNAITINMYYAGPKERVMQPITASTPKLRDVRIENVTATGAQTCCEIIGLPESPVKNVVLSHVNLAGVKGMTVRDAQGVVLDQVVVTPTTGEPLTSQFADVTWKK